MVTLLALAFAGEPRQDWRSQEEALVEAAAGELTRNATSLRLPDSPAIYHLRYRLGLRDSVYVHASRGAVVDVDEEPAVGLDVEVRVGEAGWDNTGMAGWQVGFLSRAAPAWSTPDALRLLAWRLTDRGYKQAVEQLSRKDAQVVRPDDHPGDYVLTPPVQADGGRGEPLVTDGLEGLARALSAALDRPELELAEVHVGAESGAVWILDNEGGRVRRPVAEVSVRAIVGTTAEDGSTLLDERLWTVATVADLPPIERMVTQAGELADALVARRGAETLEEEYVGPVLFLDEAAASVARRLLVPQLVGTPAEADFDTFLGSIGGADGDARLRRRVLPPGWRVTDDPAPVPGSPVGWAWDDEGTPSQEVRLVEDGIVRDLLMSRTPRRGLSGSNGHGRADRSERAKAEIASVTVTPKKVVGERRLVRLGLKVAASYGHDHLIVVRSLREPFLDSYDPDADSSDGFWLPVPVEAERVSADGERTPLRGLRFAEVGRHLLRDVLAAGRPQSFDLLFGYGGEDAWEGPVSGYVGRITAPALLIGEMEVAPAPGDPARARRLPPPPRKEEG